MQEALLSAYKTYKSVKGQSQISTWFTTIVRNCALMQLNEEELFSLVVLVSRLARSDAKKDDKSIEGEILELKLVEALSKETGKWRPAHREPTLRGSESD